MKTAKYFLPLMLLMLVLTLAFAACNDGDEPEDTTVTEEQTTAPVTEAPETGAPETEAPETEAPETAPLESEVVTDEPATDELTTDELTTTEEPTTEEPDESTYSEGLEFTSNGDGTCFVSGIGTCEDLNVVIPPISPDGDKVTGIGEGAFYGCVGFTSIVIPDSVTSIGDFAFSDCTNLVSIIIPDSVTNIGALAFSWCDGLIQIENGVYYVDKWVVECDKSVSTVTLRPDTVGLAVDVFAHCNNLISIEIPDGVTIIGDYAFQRCSRLKSIKIPDGVTSIGCWAFYECSNLSSIEIPDSVTSIGQEAFKDCPGLIQIENGVHYVDKWVVECDKSVTTVTLRPDTIGIATGALSSSLKSIEIPDGVTSINAGAFYGCGGLTSIKIPESVTSLGVNVFLFCSDLTNITFTGTKAQWQAIEKGNSWNHATGTYTIHCTDGDIPKSES